MVKPQKRTNLKIDFGYAELFSNNKKKYGGIILGHDDSILTKQQKLPFTLG